MAMAMAMANLPLPLPLDSLLASSWPWLALCVATVAALRAATVATIIRTISPSYFITKHAVSSSETHLPAVSVCPPSDISSGKTLSSSTASLILGFGSRTVKTRKETASATASTSSLASECIRFEEESLLNHERRLEEASEPSMAASPSPSGRHSAGLDFRQGAIQQHFGFHFTDTFHQRHVSENNENEDLVLGCIRRPEHGNDGDLASVSSVRDSSAECLHSEDPRSSSSGIFSLPSFERQRDLDTLLDTKLGSPFTCRTSPVFCLVRFGNNTPVSESHKLVKAWPGNQKKLLEALGIHQSSAFSLDVQVKECIACIGSTDGYLALWDMGAMESSYAVSTYTGPALVTSLNSERGLWVYANDSDVGILDPKSNLHKNVGEWNTSSAMKTAEKLALRTCGDLLLISGDNESPWSMYDLRKLPDAEFCLPQHMPFTGSDAAPDFHLNNFWERLAYDVEDGTLDDYGTDYNGSTSIVSRAVGLLENSLHLYNRW